MYLGGDAPFGCVTIRFESCLRELLGHDILREMGALVGFENGGHEVKREADGMD